MDFKKFYASDFSKVSGVLNVPFNLEHLRINEAGEVEYDLEMQYLKEYVNSGFLKLSIEDRTFDNLQEAYEYHDSLLLEADVVKEKPKRLAKNQARIVDPDTGEQRTFEVSLGNIKVGGDTICMNMSTAHECMSLIIGTCHLGRDGQCYALDTEKRFNASKNKSEESSKQWTCMTPKGLAMGIDALMKKMSGSKKAINIKYLRLNNAGEIRNLPSNPELLAKVPDAIKAKVAGIDDVAKLKGLGEALMEMQNSIKIYTYTHRTDLELGELPENVVINGSGYMISNNFFPVEYDDYNKIIDAHKDKTIEKLNGEEVKLLRLCKGDCRFCDWCKYKQGAHILIAIHGGGSKAGMALQKTLETVFARPEVEGILLKDVSDDVKAQEIINLAKQDKESWLKFVRIIMLKQDQIDMFKKIIQSKGNIGLITKALEEYASSSYSDKGNLNVAIDANAGLIASVDNLIGKFADNQKTAIEKNQTNSLKKWTRLSKQLETLISKAKKGEEIKPSSDIAKRFKSLHTQGTIGD